MVAIIAIKGNKMIETQIDKRNRSFLLMIFCIGISLLLVLLLPRYIELEEDTKQFDTVATTIGLLMLGKLFFWFKGFYHWSKGKGHSGVLALIGILGIPIGLM